MVTQISTCALDFTCFGYTSRSELVCLIIWQFYFKYWRNCHRVFQTLCTILPSSQQPQWFLGIVANVILFLLVLGIKCSLAYARQVPHNWVTSLFRPFFSFKQGLTNFNRESSIHSISQAGTELIIPALAFQVTGITGLHSKVHIIIFPFASPF